MTLRWKSRRGIDDPVPADPAAIETEWFWCELELLAQQWDALEHRSMPTGLAGDWAWANLPPTPKNSLISSPRSRPDGVMPRVRQDGESTAWPSPMPPRRPRGAISGEPSPEQLGGIFPQTIGMAPIRIQPRARARASGPVTRADRCFVDLLTLHAVETTQSVVSVALLDGLQRHYGLIERDATMYFRIQDGTAVRMRWSRALRCRHP